jgi:hypothetical protein
MLVRDPEEVEGEGAVLVPSFSNAATVCAAPWGGGLPFSRSALKWRSLDLSAEREGTLRLPRGRQKFPFLGAEHRVVRAGLDGTVRFGQRGGNAPPDLAVLHGDRPAPSSRGGGHIQWAPFSGGPAELGFAPGSLQGGMLGEQSGAGGARRGGAGGGVALWWDDVGRECGWRGCSGGSEFGAVLWTEGPSRGAVWLGWRKVGKHTGSAEVGSPAAQESMLRAAPVGEAVVAPRGTWSFPGSPLPACPAAEGRAWGQTPAGDLPAGGTMADFLSQSPASPAVHAKDAQMAPEGHEMLTARELISAARGGGEEGAPYPQEQETMRVQDGCFVGAWGAWGACSYPCGGGVMSRARRVFPPRGRSAAQCPPREEARACNTDSCGLPGAGDRGSTLCRMFGVGCP